MKSNNFRLAIISIAMLMFTIFVACKTAILGPTYPVDDFSNYDFVVVAKVEHSAHLNDGYRDLKSFDLCILKCLKGNLEVGNKISGRAKTEEAKAVCPVQLSEGEDYLLLLTKTDKIYQLSRFSFPVKKGHEYFEDYIVQIEEILKSN